MFRRFLSALFAATMLATLPSFCPSLSAASLRTDSGEEDELPPDFNYIRSKAEAGSVKAQTLLGDFYMAASDFTNAVVWYRKASEQGEVGAQLTLASCLITGRGIAKDPHEAAKWLREAARMIESPKTLPQPAVAVATNVVVSAARALVITRTGIAPASTDGVSATNAAAPSVAASSSSRGQRVDSLQAIEPVLQEPRPALKPYSDSQ